LVFDAKRGGHRLRVIENRVLRRIFGPTGNEMTEGWRKLHNGELCNSSPSDIRMINSKKMVWVEHAARIEKKMFS
jgi:hypothetical protein